MKTYAICGISNRAVGQFILPLIGNPKLPEDFFRVRDAIATYEKK